MSGEEARNTHSVCGRPSIAHIPSGNRCNVHVAVLPLVVVGQSGAVSAVGNRQREARLRLGGVEVLLQVRDHVRHLTHRRQQEPTTTTRNKNITTTSPQHTTPHHGVTPTAGAIAPCWTRVHTTHRVAVLCQEAVVVIDRVQAVLDVVWRQVARLVLPGQRLLRGVLSLDLALDLWTRLACTHNNNRARHLTLCMPAATMHATA